jgi:hypothetical protein
MAKVAGSAWVEGTEFHWVSSTQSEWKFEGELVGAQTGAAPGSLWLDTSDNLIHYIDANQFERRIRSQYDGGDHSGHSDAAVHGDGAALQGSSWVEVDLVRWIATAAGDEDYAHWDETQDAHYDAHTDVSHTDTHGDGAGTHTDSYTDEPHGDSHGDDAHSDSHNDVAHQDLHSDGDTHQDYSDGPLHLDIGGHLDTHSDVLHSDTHGDVQHSDTHTDTSHTDAHGDEEGHNDSHSDIPHTDSHQDSYADGHADEPVEVGV